VIAIPVETDAMLAILNLPKEIANNGIFKEHQGLVLEMIHAIVLQEPYDRAIQEDLPEQDPLLISCRFGFSFLMLHSTAEFLNLKTLGEGIVKAVGLDQSATELLTGSEIDAFKANLELRALSILQAYLNPVGLDRLDELKPRPPRVIRVGVI
jgi:hypothetical protein